MFCVGRRGIVDSPQGPWCESCYLLPWLIKKVWQLVYTYLMRPKISHGGQLHTMFPLTTNSFPSSGWNGDIGSFFRLSYANWIRTSTWDQLKNFYTSLMLVLGSKTNFGWYVTYFIFQCCVCKSQQSVHMICKFCVSLDHLHLHVQILYFYTIMCKCFRAGKCIY